MSRPLRIQFADALYHVTSRGDRGEPIYHDDEDRRLFLGVLAEVVGRFDWLCHAYCLMTNHYHLVLETPKANLSKGMRQLNGVFTQGINRRRRQSGHLFQGRFKAILVDKDAHWLEASRYVVLNPVRAGMAVQPGDWPWSSYRAMAGEAPTPDWLAVDGLLSQFGEQREDARRRYRNFVAEGVNQGGIWQGLRQQIYLGNEDFVERMQKNARISGGTLAVPLSQRLPPAPSLPAIDALCPSRDEAIAKAYSTGAYSYGQLAEYFGLHPSTIGRIVRQFMK